MEILQPGPDTKLLSDMISRGKSLVKDISLCSAVLVPTITASHLAGVLQGNIGMVELWNDQEFNHIFNVLVDDLMAIFEAPDALAEPLNAAIKKAVGDRFLSSSIGNVGIKTESYNFVDPDQICSFNPAGSVTDFVETYYYSEYGVKAREYIAEGAVKDLAHFAYETNGVLCMGVLTNPGDVLTANLSLTEISGLPILMSQNIRTGKFKYSVGVGRYTLPKLEKSFLVELLDYGPVGIGATTKASEWNWE